MIGPCLNVLHNFLGGARVTVGLRRVSVLVFWWEGGVSNVMVLEEGGGEAELRWVGFLLVCVCSYNGLNLKCNKQNAYSDLRGGGGTLDSIK